jgi:hypothetical protein
MARKKIVSKIIDAANARLSGVKSIDPKLDLGNGLTVEIYTQKIEAASNSLNDYNTALSSADEKYGIQKEKELDLKDFHERMLLTVGGIYGKNSAEYEMAGGKKKSNRKKAVKKKAPAVQP